MRFQRLRRRKTRDTKGVEPEPAEQGGLQQRAGCVSRPSSISVFTRVPAATTSPHFAAELAHPVQLLLLGRPHFQRKSRWRRSRSQTISGTQVTSPLRTGLP